MSYTGLARGKCPVHCSLHYHLGGVKGPKDTVGGGGQLGSQEHWTELGKGDGLGRACP